MANAPAATAATQAMSVHDTPTMHHQSDAGAPSGGSSASLIAQQRMMDRLKQATLGDYEILAELGRGGMATVYLAHDISLDRKVAIKVMSPALLDGDGSVERFKREARTAGALSHPHIIPIHAVRESGELLYFVMKYVEGRPLDDVIRAQGPLPVPMVVQILGEVAGALAYAHRKGVVHRDMKPSNIMLDDDGWAVVTDFGIAKVAQKEALTLTGSTVGTPAYMSPEQCSGAKDITGRSDQYSLGIVAYELLTGRVPFSSDSLMGFFLAHLNDAPPPIEQVRPDCPRDLAAIIARMMAKAPEDRFPSLEDVVTALTGLQQPDTREKTRVSMSALARVSDGRPRPTDFERPESPVPASRPSRPSGTSTPAAAPDWSRRPRWLIPVAGLPIAAGVLFAIMQAGGPRSAPVADSLQRSPPVTLAAGEPPVSIPATGSDTLAGRGGVGTPTAGASGSDTARLSPTGAPPPAQRAPAASEAKKDSVRAPVTAAPQPLPAAQTPSAAAAATEDASREKAEAAPVAIDAPSFTAISAGGSTTCGALANEGGVVCWGLPSPSGEMVRGLLFEKISVGDGHICGLTPAGEAYCWGSNASGQLGDGSSTERPGPTAVKATQRFAEISVGAGHTCALTADGAAFCWGANRFGQVGDGSRSNRNRPVPVRSTAGNQGFQSIAAGGSHTCGITRANKAFCWGDGFSGQVGNSMLDFAQEPFAVKTDLAFRTVVAGDRHTCGLTTNGRIYCWGSNKDGQLGNETRDDRSVPDSVVTDQLFVSVGAGGSHSCGISNRRQLLCWGQNADGRLGDGTRSLRTVPVTAANGQAFSRVSAGSGHTCALTPAGHAMCWGGNARGQLGSGSATNYSASPVLVKIRGT